MSGGTNNNPDDMILSYIQLCDDFRRTPTFAELEKIGISTTAVIEQFGDWYTFLQRCDTEYELIDPGRKVHIDVTQVPETSREADWDGENDDPFMSGADEDAKTQVIRADSIGGPYSTGTTKPLGAVLSTASPETKAEVLAAGGFEIPASQSVVEPEKPISGVMIQGAAIASKLREGEQGKIKTLQGVALAKAIETAQAEIASQPAPEEAITQERPVVVRKTTTLMGIGPQAPLPPEPQVPGVELKAEDFRDTPDDVYLTTATLAELARTQQQPQSVDRSLEAAVAKSLDASFTPKPVEEVTRVGPAPADEEVTRIVRPRAEAVTRVAPAPFSPSSPTIPASDIASSSPTVPAEAVSPSSPTIAAPESYSPAAARDSLFEDDEGEATARLDVPLPAIPSVVVEPSMGAYDGTSQKSGAVAEPIEHREVAGEDQIGKMIKETIADAHDASIAAVVGGASAEPAAQVPRVITEVMDPAEAAAVDARVAALVAEKSCAEAPVALQYKPKQEDLADGHPIGLIASFFQEYREKSAARAATREARKAEELKQKLEKQAAERPTTSGNHTVRNWIIGGVTALALTAGAIGFGSYLNSRNGEDNDYSQSHSAVVDAGTESHDAGLDGIIAMNDRDAAREDAGSRVGDASQPDSQDVVAPVVPLPDNHDDNVAPVPDNNDDDHIPAFSLAGGCSIRLGMEFNNTNYVDAHSADDMESYVLQQFANGQREFFVYGFASIEDHGRSIHDDNSYNTRLALRRALKAKADLIRIVRLHNLEGVTINDAVSWSETEVFAPGVSPEDRGILVSTAALDDPDTNAGLASVLSSYAPNVPQGDSCDSQADEDSGSGGRGSGSVDSDDTSGSNQVAPPAGGIRTLRDIGDESSQLSPEEVPIYLDYLMNAGTDDAHLVEIALSDLPDDAALDDISPLPDNRTMVRQIVQQYKNCVFGNAYSKADFSARFRQRFGYDVDIATARAIVLQDYDGVVDSSIMDAVREMNSLPDMTDEVVELEDRLPLDELPDMTDEAILLEDAPAEKQYTISQLEDMRDIYVHFYDKVFDQRQFAALAKVFNLEGSSWAEVSYVGRQVLDGNMNPVYAAQDSDVDIPIHVAEAEIDLDITVGEPELDLDITLAPPEDAIDITVRAPMTERELALEEVIAQLTDLSRNIGQATKPAYTDAQARTVYELSQQGYDFDDIRRIVSISGLNLTPDNYGEIRSMGLIDSLAEPRQNPVDEALAGIIPGYTSPKQYSHADDPVIELTEADIMVEDDEVTVLGDEDIELLDDDYDSDVDAVFDSISRDLKRPASFEQRYSV